MELYEFHILLCLTWRLDCDYYLGLYIGQFRPITDFSCRQKHVSLYHVLGPMFYATVTSDNDIFRECYGTLWNFLMCLMERNNYVCTGTGKLIKNKTQKTKYHSLWYLVFYSQCHLEQSSATNHANLSDLGAAGWLYSVHHYSLLI